MGRDRRGRTFHLRECSTPTAPISQSVRHSGRVPFLIGYLADTVNWPYLLVLIFAEKLIEVNTDAIPNF
jgi:hypothetical protein